jgi:hypothetical protein
MDATVTVDSNHEIDILGLCRPIVESSPMPMAAVQGAGRIVRYLQVGLDIISAGVYRLASADQSHRFRSHFSWIGGG